MSEQTPPADTGAPPKPKPRLRCADRQQVLTEEGHRGGEEQWVDGRAADRQVEAVAIEQVPARQEVADAVAQEEDRRPEGEGDADARGGQDDQADRDGIGVAGDERADPSTGGWLALGPLHGHGSRLAAAPGTEADPAAGAGQRSLLSPSPIPFLRTVRDVTRRPLAARTFGHVGCAGVVPAQPRAARFCLPSRSASSR